jgi:hypothetical protein
MKHCTDGNSSTTCFKQKTPTKGGARQQRIAASNRV